MTTESVDTLKDELVAHKRNKQHGEATIAAIQSEVTQVCITFELPRGEDTFQRRYADTDELWASLYELTDARPPCIDELDGETIPVTWNEQRAQWELDVQIPLDDIDEGSDEIPTEEIGTHEWSERVKFPFVAVVLISISAGFFAGSYSGTTVMYLFFAVIVLAWVGLSVYTYPQLRNLYQGRYEWVKA